MQVELFSAELENIQREYVGVLFFLKECQTNVLNNKNSKCGTEKALFKCLFDLFHFKSV